MQKLVKWFLLAVQSSGQPTLGQQRCDRWGACKCLAEGENHQQEIGQ
jgi:hypothetical protein